MAEFLNTQPKFICNGLHCQVYVFGGGPDDDPRCPSCATEGIELAGHEVQSFMRWFYAAQGVLRQDE